MSIVAELQGRASNPDTNNPNAAVPQEQAPSAQAPGNKSPGAQMQTNKYPLLSDLVAGNPPAVYAPAGMKPTPQIAEQTNIGVVQHLGLAVYRPHDPEIAAVLFNPHHISLKELQKADKAGKLDKVAKPIAEYFGDGPGGVGDGPTGGLIGNQVTQDQPANAPSPALIAIQPKSTFSADAQKMAAEMRSKNFAPQDPTAGPVPGGGVILNCLLKRAQ